MDEKTECQVTDRLRWNDLSDLLADQIKALIAAHEWKQVGQIIDSYRGAGRKSSEIEILGILYDL